MEHHGLLFQVFVYLVAAVISVPVAKRLGMGSVLGYILAGVIIGPYVLGFGESDQSDVMHFSEFGVVMMLFIIGLEIKPSLLWKMRAKIIGTGALQVALTAVVIMIITMLFNLPWQSSLAVGLILSLSSTAIVIQTLKEKGWIQSPSGKSAFSVLLFQDIAVIPMLAILPLLATQAVSVEQHTLLSGLPAWMQTLVVIASVSIIVFSGIYLMRPAFRFIAETKLREIFTAAALLLVIATALMMQLVGLSPALGTFIAGVVLAESEYRHELETNIEPFKGLLLGLFFISVGSSINFNLLAQEFLLISGIVLMTIVVKFVVLCVVGLISRMRL